MTHAIGRRAAAVIAAALLGLGVASTAAAAAPAPAAVAPLVWEPYSYHRTSGECTDMRYYLRDLGYYPLTDSMCIRQVGHPTPWWLMVND